MINNGLETKLLVASKKNTTVRIDDPDLTVLKSLLNSYNLSHPDGKRATSLRSLIHGLIDHMLSTTTEEERYEIVNKYVVSRRQDELVDQFARDMVMSLCHLNKSDLETLKKFDDKNDGYVFLGQIIKTIEKNYDPDLPYVKNMVNILTTGAIDDNVARIKKQTDALKIDHLETIYNTVNAYQIAGSLYSLPTKKRHQLIKLLQGMDHIDD